MIIRIFLFFFVLVLAGCSNIQMKQNWFAPENQLFLDGKFSFVEEKQNYVIQESGWGKFLERAAQIISFPFAMFQSGNSLESQYDKSLIKITQSKKKNPEIPVDILTESKDSEARGLAIELTSDVKVLLKHLKDPSDFVRMQALEKLREHGSTLVVSEIEGIVRHDVEEFVRIEGIRTLKELHFPEALNTIAFCLRDPGDHIRREAVLALENYTPKQAIPLLLKILNDPIFFVREAAKKTLIKQVKENFPSETIPSYNLNEPIEIREQKIEKLKLWWLALKKKG